MHKVFGTKENINYIDRVGVYLVPMKEGKIGVVKTSKGYFLLGGGLGDDESYEECIKRECLEEVGYTEADVKMLEKMHKEKIKISDAILVVNVNDYIGSSTQKEIEYAKSLNKEVLYYTDCL